MRWTVRDAALNILTSSAVHSHITQVEVSVLSVEMIEVSSTIYLLTYSFIIYLHTSMYNSSFVRIICVKILMHCRSNESANFG
jgi:hypothetical protein